MKELLYYDCLTEFKKQYYEGILTNNNLIDNERFFDIVKDMNGQDKQLDFKYCYVLEKNGKKYLLPSKYKKALPIKIVLEEKVAYRNEAYYYIVKCTSVRFKPEKKMTFKKLIDSLSSLQHSHPTQNRLSWFYGLSSMLDRVNVRLCSPAGFGKDSVIDICGGLLGDASTIENPTIAKLEYMTAVKWLAVNEAVNISKSDWRNVEQFLLQTGAFKNTITKHSRAVAGGVSELMDISHFSIAIFFNDIDHFPDEEKYFDNIVTKQLKDRFLPIRLHGHFTEDFNSTRNINIPELVAKNQEKYVNIIRTFYYYRDNYEKELKHYNVIIPKILSSRQRTNYLRILRMIDLYSDSQEEFDSIVKELNDSIDDYYAMLKYPTNLRQLITKYGNDSKEFKRVLEEPTFIKRNSLINTMLNTEQSYEDKNINSFWEK